MSGNLKSVFKELLSILIHHLPPTIIREESVDDKMLTEAALLDESKGFIEVGDVGEGVGEDAEEGDDHHHVHDDDGEDKEEGAGESKPKSSHIQPLPLIHKLLLLAMFGG
jgi:hypothetical protein